MVSPFTSRAAHLTVSRCAHHQSQSLNFPDSSLATSGLVFWALIRDQAAMPFSRECAEDRRVQPGSSSWWGVLLEPNTDPATLESHPFKCALLCGHTYTLQGANATKVANHVSGEGGGIRACSRATAEDKVLVTDKRRTPVQSSTAMLHDRSHHPAS